MSSKPPSSPRLPRYNPSRDRRRITWTVMSLAIVLIAISEARKPKNWTWLAPPADAKRGEAAALQPRVQDELAPDQVRIVAERPVRLPGRNSPETDDDSGLRIPPELLDRVDDARVGVRAAELPAYFAMLQTVADAPPGKLAAAARRDLPYPTLLNDPAEHRGAVVWLEGELRRLTQIEAGPNDEGFEHLYEGWLFTDEAGRTNPYRIVCVETPEGFPLGDDVRARIRLAGCFFKRYGYATSHGQHFAPMVVCRGFEWVRDPQERALVRGLPPVLMGLVAAAAFALTAALVWIRSSNARPNRRPGPQRTATTDPAQGDAREFLGRLERETNPPDGA